MSDELQMVILKDETKGFHTKFTPIHKFNENYHKYVSDEHNAYFVIPVTNLSNLYMVYDRESMPKIFRPVKIHYTLEIIKIHHFAEITSFDGALFHKQPDRVLHTQSMTVDIATPHDLFTFIYNLNELILFNTQINDDRSFMGLSSAMFIYSISDYRINGEWIDKNGEIGRVSDLVDIILGLYSMPMNELNSYELCINSDHTCAYSDPLKIHGKTDIPVIGEPGDANTIISLRIPIMVSPIYTFIRRKDETFLNDVNTYYTGTGNVMFFMGTGLDAGTISNLEGTFFMADEAFSMCKVSSIIVPDMVDMIIYIKVALIIMRIALQLVTIKDEFQTFDGWIPAFRYEVKVRWMNDKHATLTKMYTVHSEKELLAIDPYEQFMNFLEDFSMPF